MNYYDFIQELNNLDEEFLIEMATATKDDTNLPYDIWIDTAGAGRNNKHHLIRIKVNVDNILIPILVSDNPDIPESVKKSTGIKTFPHINKVKKFIIQNKDILTRHWNGEINDRVLLNGLIPYSN